MRWSARHTHTHNHTHLQSQTHNHKHTITHTHTHTITHIYNHKHTITHIYNHKHTTPTTCVDTWTRTSPHGRRCTGACFSINANTLRPKGRLFYHLSMYD